LFPMSGLLSEFSSI